MDENAAPSDGLIEFDNLVAHRAQFLQQAEDEAAQVVRDEAQEPAAQQSRRRDVRRRWLERTPG